MPLPLPTYQREQLRIQDSLLDSWAKISLANTVYMLDFNIYNRDFVDASSNVIKILARKEPIFLQVPYFLIEKVLQSVWPNFHSLEGKLRTAVLEEGLKEIINAAEEKVGEVSIEEISSLSPEDHVSMEFFLTSSKDRYRCFIYAKKNGFALLQKLNKKEDGKEFLPPIYLPLSAVIGNVLVSAAQMRQLQSGDLIFFENKNDEKQVFLSIGKFYWEGKMEKGGKVMVTKDELKPAEVSPQKKKAQPPPVEAKKPSAAPAPQRPEPKKINAASIDKIDLELTFELGRSLVKFEELKEVKKGYLFDFPHMKEPRVNICINGQKVGDGELVKIDGSLAVRVMNLEE